MTQYLSRRERRAAEKSGIPESLTVPAAEPATQSSVPVYTEANNFVATDTSQGIANSFLNESVFENPEIVDSSPVIEVVTEAIEVRQNQFPSRRALREGRQVFSAQEPVEAVEIIQEPQLQSYLLDTKPEEMSLTGSRDLVIEIDEPVVFSGSNLLAEPSTQSIVLDIVPEAVSLPIEVTGEIVSTGSIAVIPDSTAAVVTATMDGSQLDQIAIQDAVTGVISVVEPVSAASVISERENIGVVPDKTLRKGWWIRWAIGIGALIMAAIAVWATLTILEFI